MNITDLTLSLAWQQYPSCLTSSITRLKRLPNGYSITGSSWSVVHKLSKVDLSQEIRSYDMTKV
jgi:hypothetical protein